LFALRWSSKKHANGRLGIGAHDFPNFRNGLERGNSALVRWTTLSDGRFLPHLRHHGPAAIAAAGDSAGSL